MPSWTVRAEKDSTAKPSLKVGVLYRFADVFQKSHIQHFADEGLKLDSCEFETIWPSPGDFLLVTEFLQIDKETRTSYETKKTDCRWLEWYWGLITLKEQGYRPLRVRVAAWTDEISDEWEQVELD